MAAAHLPSITSMTGVRMTAVHLPPMHAPAIVEADDKNAWRIRVPSLGKVQV